MQYSSNVTHWMELPEPPEEVKLNNELEGVE
ncbi:DUF551 domain-containing protein [Photorhabdus temperata]|nr:DUF551 domain-containing protein [Photorhabdus temperata]